MHLPLFHIPFSTQSLYVRLIEELGHISSLVISIRSVMSIQLMANTSVHRKGFLTRIVHEVCLG